MSVGAALVNAGHDVRIVDAEAESLGFDEVVERILAYHPDFIGVTSTTPEFPAAQALIQAVKRRQPDVITILGGAQATHVPWLVLDQTDGLDYAVVYEGEKAAVAIVDQDQEKLREYSTNAQILMRRTGADHPEQYAGRILLAPVLTREELERLRPLRSQPYLDTQYYKAADPEFGLLSTASIETARGCPFRCRFCTSASSGWRVRSVESVLDELEELSHEFSKSGEIGFVTFLDDTLTASRARATALFEGILRRGLRLRYQAFTRANALATREGRTADVAFAGLMRRAGSVAISLGIESGSEHIHKRINKGVQLDDYRRAYEILDAVKFEERRGSFIVGHPYETADTIRESIAFAKELGLHRLGVHIMTPYPGTEMYNIARAGDGLYFEERARDYAQYRRWGRSIVSTETLTTDALEYWHRRFLAEAYTASHALRHSVSEFWRGNRSRYYHRPTFQAVRDRLRMTLNSEWSRPDRFPAPDHSSYAPEQWPEAHVSKRTCMAVLHEVAKQPLGEVQRAQVHSERLHPCQPDAVLSPHPPAATTKAPTNRQSADSE